MGEDLGFIFFYLDLLISWDFYHNFYGDRNGIYSQPK